MFSLYNKHYLSLVDYETKCTVIKKTASLSIGSLILIFKIVFVEYRLPEK